MPLHQKKWVPCNSYSRLAKTDDLCWQGRCNQDSNARSVTIMITDSCPECEGDHLDIQVQR